MKRGRGLIKTYPDEALLDEVRRVAELVNKPVLTCSDFAKHSGISARTMLRRFGKWHDVLERAGLEHLFSGEPGSRKYSDEDLLEELRRVAELVDKPVLTEHDFDGHPGMKSGVVRNRFGGWRNALERAGLAHLCSRLAEAFARPPRNYSDEEWKNCGGPPSLSTSRCSWKSTSKDFHGLDPVS